MLLLLYTPFTFDMTGQCPYLNTSIMGSVRLSMDVYTQNQSSSESPPKLLFRVGFLLGTSTQEYMK